MRRYFYAGGERRELEPVEDRLAINVRGATSAGLGEVVEKVEVASRLPAGMIVVERAALAESAVEQLKSVGAVQPVYRHGRAHVVLMPEVRVEFDAGNQHDAAVKAVSASDVDAELTDDTPERLSLRPRSGSAEDALDLANFIYEHANPASSTVRMLQIVPKPITRK